MDFDWTVYSAPQVTPAEAAESFEDPFSLRILPDASRFAQQARFFSLGRTLSGRGLFAIYTSTGRVTKVITTRQMTPEEEFFYDRKAKESLG